MSTLVERHGEKVIDLLPEIVSKTTRLISARYYGKRYFNRPNTWGDDSYYENAWKLQNKKKQNVYETITCLPLELVEIIQQYWIDVFEEDFGDSECEKMRNNTKEEDDDDDDTDYNRLKCLCYSNVIYVEDDSKVEYQFEYNKKWFDICDVNVNPGEENNYELVLKDLELDTQLFPHNWKVGFNNLSGVNDDHRGSDHCKLDLEFHDCYDLKSNTWKDFIDAYYRIKSHKFDSWYELFCYFRRKIQHSDRMTQLTYNFEFDHGS